MEGLPPTFYLPPLACICCISLAALLVLIWGFIHRFFYYAISIQLAIVCSKSAIDIAAVIFGALEYSGRLHLNDRKIRLINYILFWGSSICVPTYEHFFLWAIYRDQCSTTYPGRIIHDPKGIGITIILCLVPLITVRFPKDEYLLVFGTTGLHFLLFGGLHLWLFARLNLSQKWISPLVTCFISCFIVFAASIAFLVTGWRKPEYRGFLLQLILITTSIHISVRVLLCTIRESKKRASEAIQHMSHSQRPATSTSQKALTRNASVGCYHSTVALVTEPLSPYKPPQSRSNAECDHKTQDPSYYKPPASLTNTEKSGQGEQATAGTDWATSEHGAELGIEDHEGRSRENGIMLLLQK